MAILVTGGCGLVGSFAVREALIQGEKVVAFDLALKKDLLEDVADRVTFFQGNVLHAVDLARAVRENGVKRILHTASFLTPGAYARPYAATETTIMGTLNVLEVARALQLERVSYVSTGKTAWSGAAFAQSQGSGELAIDPDPYTSSKIGAELLCNDYRKMYELDVVILRIGGQVFGPGLAFTGAIGQGLQPLIELPLRGESVTVETPILPFSAPVMPMLYARDAGRGSLLATASDGLKHYVYDIAPVENCTLEETVKIIQEVIPGADITTPPSELKGGPAQIDQNAKAEFGYEPHYDARRGIREYVQFLKSGTYAEVE